MIFSSYIDCGNCGPTAGSGRCIPCERESQLEGYFHQGPEAAAVTSSEALVHGHQPAWKSIALGVGTGLAVWAVTRFLDAHILGKRRAR